LKCPYKAFTLKVLANRIYVICDPALIQAAYKNSKVFDFTTFVVDSSKKGFEISEDGMKVIRGETAPGYDPKGPFLNGNNGPSFLNENHDVMYKTLSPGPGLLELNSGVLNLLAFSVNELGSEVLEISLYKWMRDLLTLATSSALYGPHDPLHSDPSLVDALWYEYPRRNLLEALTNSRILLGILKRTLLFSCLNFFQHSLLVKRTTAGQI
jgi:hypothetical protein